MAHEISVRKLHLGLRGHGEHSSNLRRTDVVMIDDWPYVALRVGKSFTLLRLEEHIPQQHDRRFFLSDTDHFGTIYRPLHPSTTPEDIEGATYAKDNGTSWEFAHCSPGEQIDLAAEVRSFTEMQFAIKIGSLCAAAIRASEANEGPTGRRAAALAFFAEKAGEKAYSAVLAESLGHFHRNPHADHRRILARAAYTELLEEWKKLAEAPGASDHVKGNYDDVKADVAATITKLSSTHTIKTLHESRLAKPVFAMPKTSAQQTWTVGQAITPVVIPEPEKGYPKPVYTAPFLPTGFLLDADTRTLSGTPMTTGEGTITVKATNSEGTDSYSVPYTIVAQ